MPWGHSKNTVIKVGADDISVHVNTSDLSRSATIEETGGYGKGSKVKAGSQLDAKFTLGGTYDTGASATPKAVFSTHVGETLTITRRPEGTGSGRPQQVFDAVLADYVESSPLAGYIKWTATLEVSDDIDDTPQA